MEIDENLCLGSGCQRKGEESYFAKVSVDVFGNHGLGGLLEEGGHEKSPKCLDGNLGDFGEFCKGLRPSENFRQPFTF